MIFKADDRSISLRHEREGLSPAIELIANPHKLVKHLCRQGLRHYSARRYFGIAKEAHGFFAEGGTLDGGFFAAAVVLSKTLR